MEEKRLKRTGRKGGLGDRAEITDEKEESQTSQDTYHFSEDEYDEDIMNQNIYLPSSVGSFSLSD